MNTIELVKEFHETFGHPIGKTPHIPNEGTVDFRVGFIKEELNELLAAFASDDLVEFADGLGDIQYVLDGFFLNAGLHDKKEAIMAEIHRSNMSKVCKSKDDAENTIMSLLAPEKATIGAAMKYHSQQVGRYWIVYRSADNKVMKSINYSKPDLKSIING